MEVNNLDRIINKISYYEKTVFNDDCSTHCSANEHECTD